MGLLAVALTGVTVAEPVHFSGFGSLSVVHSDNDSGDYTANYEQQEGVGRTQQTDYGLDTVFGLQADAQLVPGLTATAQMQSRRVADGSATPYFEWANLKYRINDDFSVRIGRVVAPLFMASDSRAVGYSQTALRLPPDVYLLNPVSYLDGGDIKYQFERADVIYTATATVGKYEKMFPTIGGDTNVEFDAQLLDFKAETGASTFRLGIGKASVDFKTPLLKMLDDAVAGLVEAGVPRAPTLQDHLDHRGFQGLFANVGYAYDSGRYLVQAEYVVRRSESFWVYDVDGFYLLGGIRAGAFTPYVRYAQVNCLNRDADLPALDTGGLEPALATVATLVNQFTDALKVYDERNTWTAGIRWDFADNYALKAEIDHISKPGGNAGQFINTTPEFEARAQSVNVLSLALDFIF